MNIRRTLALLAIPAVFLFTACEKKDQPVPSEGQPAQSSSVTPGSATPGTQPAAPEAQAKPQSNTDSHQH